MYLLITLLAFHALSHLVPFRASLPFGRLSAKAVVDRGLVTFACMHWGPAKPVAWKVLFPARVVGFRTLFIVRFPDQGVMLRTNGFGYLKYSGDVGGNWITDSMITTQGPVLGHLNLLSLPLWPFTFSPAACGLALRALRQRRRGPSNGFEVIENRTGRDALNG